MGQVRFEHDGHQFDVREERDASTAGADSQFRWQVHMDGQLVLEFHGHFPYRDEDVRKRVLEWYEIQKPRR